MKLIEILLLAYMLCDMLDIDVMPDIDENQQKSDLKH